MSVSAFRFFDAPFVVYSVLSIVLIGASSPAMADGSALRVPDLAGASLLSHEDFADPFVLRDGDAYYAFATSAFGKHVQVARSSDLTSWAILPDALPHLPDWASKDAGFTWAPSVLRRGLRYVLYYTARDSVSGFQCISRAVSNLPAGPYIDDSTSPFLCQATGDEKLCGSIDPSPFVDPAGGAYLLWKSDENSAACSKAPRIWVQRLGEDGLALTGPRTALMSMDQPWENPIIEGPSMVVEGGVYYLFYSANRYESGDYSIGYATCESPTGPCAKVTTKGPLVKSSGPDLGPGGQEFFSDKAGQTRMIYHAWSAPHTTYLKGGARSLRVARLTFVGGVPVVEGTAPAEQALH